ncbi:MAG: DPP IV N-terminal domain-containing protein [Crocinitomicaceae bacterium]|nr:DPP IV N-terminal domain-containing protein [Crocinitomicaceae bacterium]
MKKIISFLFVGLAVLSTQAQLKEITLKESVMQQYRAFYPTHTAGVNWIPGTDTYVFMSADYKTMKKNGVKKDAPVDILTLADLNTWTGSTFTYINVLEWKDANSFYTSTEGKYFLVNLTEKKATALATLPGGAEGDELCTVTNTIAYTIDNNLYIRTAQNAETQITNFEKNIVSGKSIARNEFGIADGIFWSPTGNYLAFYQKDESDVADYPLLDITTPTGSAINIKYPMAGQGSEKPAVGIYNLKTGKTVYIKPTGKADDYLTNVGWGMDDKYLYIAEVNRGQNHMKLIQYDAETGALVKILLEEKSDKWVEPEHAPYFVSPDMFLWMSEKDGFMNLYLYKTDGSFLKQVTSNKWVTQGIIGHDVAGNIYTVGTGESPLETNYFKINIASGVQTRLTAEVGTHDVHFSSDYKYFYDSYSAHATPNIEILKSTAGKNLRTTVTAENPYKERIIGTTEIGTIKAADGTTDLYYRLIKPSNFDATKKYPVLVYVYGGPHAQLITNSWGSGANLWMHWMAEQGYLVYTLDNRGSDNRGFAFESVIHRQLGTVEMDDQLKGVEHLKSMPFVDGDRLAVHGWSFGGFMTTSLMLRHPGVFQVGVAGGPVTDWAYYEVMYGERYMDTPEENKEGYEKNRLMNYAKNLKGELLLIHGTIDDVVVMQHNYALVKAFVEAEIQMDFFPYPMHPHNVRGKDRVHLMTKVLTYVLEEME